MMTTARSAGKWITAGVAVIFGVLTVFSGAAALFGSLDAQASVGNAVPFVLWFNFLSGFVYVIAGIAIALGKPWAGKLATILALAILAVFALFGWHVWQGGAYEARTVGAMTLRTAVWILIAAWLVKVSGQGKQQG